MIVLLITAVMLSAFAAYLILHYDQQIRHSNGKAADGNQSWGDSESLLRSVQDAIESGDFTKAEKLSTELLNRSPQNVPALLAAAQASAQLGKTDLAIEYCDRIPGDLGQQSEIAAWVPCELLFRSQRFTECLERTKKFLERFPNRSDARKRVIQLYGLAGQPSKASSHALHFIKTGQFVLEMLLYLSDTEKVVDYSATLESALKENPHDLVATLGLVRLEIATESYDSAQHYLLQEERVISKSIDGLALQGLLYVEQNNFSSLESWEATLRQLNGTSAEALRVLGRASHETDQHEWACFFLSESLRLDPCNRQTLYLLGNSLATLGRNDQAERLLRLHLQMTEYMRLCERMFGRPPEISQIISASEACLEMGRCWEAMGWIAVAKSLASVVTDRTKVGSAKAPTQQEFAALSRLESNIRTKLNSSNSGQFIADVDLSRIVDIDTRDLPPRRPFGEIGSVPKELVQGNADSASIPADVAISFRDESQETGLLFEYFCDSMPEVEGKRIYEFGGGGVGVADFDKDDCVDVYLTQGCRWPPESDGIEFHNVLMRNMSWNKFSEISSVAKVADTAFGQGVATGDVNSDGFADIYVANIGMNQLYLNQGDGTFQRATECFQQVSSKWTTSCLIADLNRDGHPDIYDVNYLKGQDIFERICIWEGNRRRICGPATHEPEQDELFINNGKLGRTGEPGFRNATDTSGIKQTGGTGLGIVAGDFRRTGEVDVFVANDQHRNFYFQLDAVDGNGMPTYTDRGVISGLAFDADGLPQACMGVAAGDADQDGYDDLFVTNYFKESNALYLQSDPGIFEDRAKATGVTEPSREMLGFGAQFIDAELDGDLDLVVTNGHLDDFTYLNQPFEMRTQILRNNGVGVFQELPSKQIGPFFQRLHRGRGLAKLDWNADGAEDFIVSLLDEPTALLTNYTEGRGSSLVLELVGVNSCRDAIGASVELKIGDQRVHRSLFAGDGYQASNERQLVFGLGAKNEASDVIIRWPSGVEEKLAERLAAGDYLVIEGKRIVPAANAGSASKR